MFLKKMTGGVQWLLVFLGNPGEKYDRTRHNVGFRTADALQKRCGCKINRLRSKALTGRCELGGQSVLLVKPQTYMNLSGESVGPLASYYKVPPERVVVISDDVALPLGRIRLRRGGSAGGHNGLKSIIQALKTDAFPRVRIGVGAPPHADYDMADWVLGSLSGEDEKILSEAIDRALDALECCLKDGVDKAMNQFNSK